MPSKLVYETDELHFFSRQAGFVVFKGAVSKKAKHPLMFSDRTHKYIC